MLKSIQLRRCSMLLLLISGIISCKETPKVNESTVKDTTAEQVAPKIKVLFDTDANNELDDQHALAYLLFNGNTFNMDVVTVNATYNGGDIQGHFDEAMRVLQLCRLENQIALLKGANGSFKEITANWDPENFDGQEAVDRILSDTKNEEIVLVAVGKLTNIALALKKDPALAERTRVVWLGSNYPEPGEYNQDNDTIAMNYVLNTKIPFEMVTVRYGDPSGSDAVSVTQEEINAKMPGLGPEARTTVTGRHGGSFNTFGDYSVSLFKYIDYHGDPPSRPLFDMVALAILKNPEWGETRIIPAPVLINNQWVERPQNMRKIKVWENFDKAGILDDFYNSLQNPVLLKTSEE